MATYQKFFSVIIFNLFTIFLFGFSQLEVKQVCLKDTCINAEVVSSKEARLKGLMDREGLAQGQGMLFVFPEEGIHSIWMKNMRFPIDIIWINSGKKVVDFYKGALPCAEPCKSIIPRAKAKYVLEVSAGFLDKNQIQIGDQVGFE